MDTSPHLVQPRARIFFNDGHTTVSCVVQSLTECGAVLQFHSVFGIPGAFKLALTDRTHRLCWVVSKTAKHITVGFTDWQPSTDVMDPETIKSQIRIGHRP